MKKRILFIIFVLIILFIDVVYSETTSSKIISDIKKSSSGVSFSDNGFGGVKINVNSLDNKVVYRDLQGKEYSLSGLLQNGQIELDSNGNIVRGSFISSKAIDVVLGGNLRVNVPANSKLVGVDGKNFDVSLASGSIIDKEPSELYPDKNNGGNVVNYKVSQKSDIKFPDFNLQEGVISHNGRYFFVKGGNNALINGLSFIPSSKDGISAIFFDESKIPTELKNGYTVVDFKNNRIRLIGGDGETSLIDLRSGNPIAIIKEENQFDIKALANGEVMINGAQGKIFSSVKGDFVMNNGKLYLKYEGGNLAGSFNNNGYDLIPVEISVQTKEGNFLLKDKNGNNLGIFVKQGENGLVQVQTSPVASSPASPASPPVETLPQKEMPNWQHNPDPVTSPVPPPITPKTSPIQYTIPAPVQNSQATIKFKQEFLRDLNNAQTATTTKWYLWWKDGTKSSDIPNLGALFKTKYPQMYNKHFAPESTSSINDLINDYKSIIAIEAKKYGSTPAQAIERLKQNQPYIYNKYGKVLGFY